MRITKDAPEKHGFYFGDGPWRGQYGILEDGDELFHCRTYRPFSYIAFLRMQGQFYKAFFKNCDRNVLLLELATDVEVFDAIGLGNVHRRVYSNGSFVTQEHD